MISRLNLVNVFVLDQDRAKAFYAEILGFDLRSGRQTSIQGPALRISRSGDSV